MNEPSLHAIRIKINSIKNKPISNLSDIQPPTVSSCTLQPSSSPQKAEFNPAHTLTVPSTIHHTASHSPWKNITEYRNNQSKLLKKTAKLNYNTVNISKIKKMVNPEENIQLNQEGCQSRVKVGVDAQDNSKTKVYWRWTVWSPSKLKNKKKCYSQNIIDKNFLELTSTRNSKNDGLEAEKKKQSPIHLTQSFIKQNSRVTNNHQEFDYISIAQGLKLQAKKKRDKSQVDFTLINYFRKANRSSESTYRQNVSAGESNGFIWYCAQKKDEERKKEITKRDWRTKDTIRPWSGFLGPQAQIM